MDDFFEFRQEHGDGLCDPHGSLVKIGHSMMKITGKDAVDGIKKIEREARLRSVGDIIFDDQQNRLEGALADLSPCQWISITEYKFRASDKEQLVVLYLGTRCEAPDPDCWVLDLYMGDVLVASGEDSYPAWDDETDFGSGGETDRCFLEIMDEDLWFEFLMTTG